MKRTLRMMGDIIAEPKAAFQALKEQPSWLGVFLIIAVVSIGVEWAIMPFSEQIAHVKMLESGLDEAQIEQVRSLAERFSIVALFFVPFPLLFKGLIFGGLLYFGIRLLGSTEALGFKHIFAIVAYSELIMVFSSLINAAVVLCLKEMSDVQASIDLQMIPGLHLLFNRQGLGAPILTVLSQITPFFIWYLIVLSLGVGVVADLSRQKSQILVLLVWLADVGFRMVMSAI